MSEHSSHMIYGLVSWNSDGLREYDYVIKTISFETQK